MDDSGCSLLLLPSTKIQSSRVESLTVTDERYPGTWLTRKNMMPPATRRKTRPQMASSMPVGIPRPCGMRGTMDSFLIALSLENGLRGPLPGSFLMMESFADRPLASAGTRPGFSAGAGDSSSASSGPSGKEGAVRELSDAAGSAAGDSGAEGADNPGSDNDGADNSGSETGVSVADGSGAGGSLRPM